MKKIYLNGWQCIGIIASVLWFFLAGCHHRNQGARPAGAVFPAKHAPLPDELIRAKSVYIVNQTGFQEVMDHAYEAFSKWNRFSMAKSKDSADAVVVFTGTTHRRTMMSVYVPNREDPVFQTTERRDAFSNFGTSAKKCVDDLKSRFKN